MELAFHIGYHKTGTSWLQQSYFREHPGIELLCNSEHPWEDKLLAYLIATPDADFDAGTGKAMLADLLSKVKSTPVERKAVLISAERLTGHPFSGGYDNVRIARRIAAIAPGARIVCVVRNQLDMIWSVYKQLVSVGFPGSLGDLAGMRSWKTTSFDLAYFEYDRLIAHYIDLFGKDRVCVLQYEFMRPDAGVFLTRLCDFIGVEYMEPRHASVRVNPSLPDESIALVRRLNYLRRSELYPLPIINLGRAYTPLRELSIKIAKRIPWLSPQRDISLLRQYAPRFSGSNARLARLLGDDFLEYRF